MNTLELYNCHSTHDWRNSDKRHSITRDIIQNICIYWTFCIASILDKQTVLDEITSFKKYDKMNRIKVINWTHTDGQQWVKKYVRQKLNNPMDILTSHAHQHHLSNNNKNVTNTTRSTQFQLRAYDVTAMKRVVLWWWINYNNVVHNFRQLILGKYPKHYTNPTKVMQSTDKSHTRPTYKFTIHNTFKRYIGKHSNSQMTTGLQKGEGE